MSLSLIIIQFGRSDFLFAHLDSLAVHPEAALISEVVVVNNALTMSSADRDRLLSTRFPFPINVVDNAGTSYASAANAGARVSAGEILIISNDDILWPKESSIQPLLESISDPRSGVVVPQFVYPDGSWQRSYGYFPSMWSPLSSIVFVDSISHVAGALAFRLNLLRRPRNVMYADGAFLCVRRQDFLDLGGYDERFSFYCDDSDFCYRMNSRGRRILFDPRTRLIHVRGGSSVQVRSEHYESLLVSSQIEFIKKHKSRTEARIFVALGRIAVWERAALYRMASAIFRSPSWKARARQALVRAKIFSSASAHVV